MNGSFTGADQEIEFHPRGKPDGLGVFFVPNQDKMSKHWLGLQNNMFQNNLILKHPKWGGLISVPDGQLWA